MNPLQQELIKRAFQDLIGAYEYKEGVGDHDWDTHVDTIKDLQSEFKEFLEEPEWGS